MARVGPYPDHGRQEPRHRNQDLLHEPGWTCPMPMPFSRDLPDQIKAHFPEFQPLEVSALVDFARALRSGRGLLLLGAGVSIDSGIPGGYSLVSSLQAEIGSRSRRLRALCTQYARCRGKYTLQKFLRTHLDDWNKPLSSLHVLVPQITDLCTVITTNIDTRLEEGCRRVLRPYQVLAFPADITFQRPQTLQIIKLHGTLEHPHTYCFSDEDYAKLSDSLTGPFGIKLHALFQDHEILTVGYSAVDDPDFDDLVAWMAAEHNGKQALSLQLEPSQAKRCRREGLFPILLRESGNEPAKTRIPRLVALLSGLPLRQVPKELTRVDRRHNPFRRLDPYTEADVNRFVGRKADLQQVSDGLATYKTLLLFGDSAVGKTSFLNAALIPHFRRLFSEEAITIESVAGDLPVRWPNLIKGIPSHQPHLLILDQFERFFDLSYSTEMRDRFLRSTLPALHREHKALRCLLVIRRESLADLHIYREVNPGLYHEAVELRPLSVEQAREVMQSHFAEGGYSLDEELIVALVQHSCVNNIPFLPALQLYGYAQFENLELRRQSDEISTASPVSRQYQIAQGDVLEQFLNEALQNFLGGDEHARMLQVLRRLIHLLQ